MTMPPPSNAGRDELEDSGPTERMHRPVIVAASDDGAKSWAPVAMDSSPDLRPSSPTFIIPRPRLGRPRSRAIGPTLAILTAMLAVGCAVAFVPRARRVVVRALTMRITAQAVRPTVPRVPDVSSARAVDSRRAKAVPSGRDDATK